MNLEQTIEKLKTSARESWSGETGEQRAVVLEKFVRNMLKNYSEKLGYSEEDILLAIESRRDYSAINYYQESKFPSLENVNVYEKIEDLLELVPSKKFRCPSCNGVSKNPYECSCDGCDWKAYGLFGCVDKGYKFTLRSKFLENPIVDTIFMPREFETVATA